MARKHPKTFFGVELEKLWIAAGYAKRAKFLEAAKLQNPTVNRWEMSHGVPREEQLQRAADALRVPIAHLQGLHRRSRRMAGLPEDAAAGDADSIVSRLPPRPTPRVERVEHDAGGVADQAALDVLNSGQIPEKEIDLELRDAVRAMAQKMAARSGREELSKGLLTFTRGYILERRERSAASPREEAARDTQTEAGDDATKALEAEDIAPLPKPPPKGKPTPPKPPRNSQT